MWSLSPSGIAAWLCGLWNVLSLSLSLNFAHSCVLCANVCRAKAAHQSTSLSSSRPNVGFSNMVSQIMSSSGLDQLLFCCANSFPKWRQVSLRIKQRRLGTNRSKQNNIYIYITAVASQHGPQANYLAQKNAICAGAQKTTIQHKKTSWDALSLKSSKYSEGLEFVHLCGLLLWQGRLLSVVQAPTVSLAQQRRSKRISCSLLQL